MRHKKTIERAGYRPKKRHRRVEKGVHSREAWELLKRMYDYRCPACGRREPEIVLTRDHIVAVALGGTSFIENLQPLCEECNQNKGQLRIYYPPPRVFNNLQPCEI